MRPLDVPALTGAFLTGAAAAATVRWWWPRLEHLDGRVQAWWEARKLRQFERAAAKRYRRMLRPGRRRQGRYRACQHASRRPNSDCPGAQICNDCGIGIIHRRARRVDFLVRDAIRNGRQP